MAGKTNYSVEQAAEIMRHVVQHMIHGGSFRNFIYGRLGFENDAYVPMYQAGGMQFTNACPVNLDPEQYPHFAWAGAHEVLDQRNGEVLVRYANEAVGTGARDHWVPCWPGHEIATGATALVVVYLSDGFASIYALKAGNHYAAWKLAEDRRSTT